MNNYPFEPMWATSRHPDDRPFIRKEYGQWVYYAPKVAGQRTLLTGPPGLRYQQFLEMIRKYLELK